MRSENDLMPSGLSSAVTKPKTLEIQQYFDTPRRYLHKDFSVKARAILCKELLGQVENAHILDIGAGDGSISLQFLSETTSITMVDLSANMLDIARAHTPARFAARVEYRHANILDCGFYECADIVLCLGVLAHVDSIRDALAAVSRALKPHGQCALQITDFEQLFGRFLGAYASVRGAISSYTQYYRINRTTFSHVVSLAAEVNLQLVARRQYSLQFPGIGKLPNHWLLKYELATARWRLLSRCGSEYLLLFVKVAGD